MIIDCGNIALDRLGDHPDSGVLKAFFAKDKAAHFKNPFFDWGHLIRHDTRTKLSSCAHSFFGRFQVEIAWVKIRAAGEGKQVVCFLAVR